MANDIETPPKRELSSVGKIVNIPDPFKHLYHAHGAKGTYIDAKKAPWIPRHDFFQQYLAFDVRQNFMVANLKFPKPGAIGTHYHHARVMLFCLEGSFRYLEYDWVARPGDFICEAAGEAHTLVTEHPEGTVLFGVVYGPVDVYDNEGNLIATEDVWTWIDDYVKYCNENNIPVDPELFI